MKLPYRAGDLFALPLGDGTFAHAEIAAQGHRWVEIAVAGMRLRVWDTALVLHRWRPLDMPTARMSSRVGALATYRGTAEAMDTVGPARAERIVATALGVANLEIPPLHVHWTRGSTTWEPAPRAIRTAEQLAAVPSDVTTLKLCGPCYELDARELCRFTELVQLELLGFWQYELRDVMPLLAHPRLVRAEIDIGGRRKNVELYRRARWAYPWPAELRVT